MATSHIADLVGRVLGGRYRLTRRLGQGAFGQVYVADDVSLRRPVAIKVLNPALADEPSFLRRFAAEAQAAAGLRHPHILRVYDWGEDDHDPYLVMELLSGGSLRSYLDQGRRLSPAQTARIGLDIAGALDYAHRRSLVHRDIKPANLIFDDEGRIAVADFGLARALADATLTEPAGTIVGTARYAAPEQVHGDSLDSRADVYSLALVLVEAVTGQVPFAMDTSLATLMRRLREPISVPGELGLLASALEAAGTVAAADRLDAGQLAARLEEVAAVLPPPDPLVLAGPLAGGGEVEVDRQPTEVPGRPSLFDIEVVEAGAGRDPGPASRPAVTLAQPPPPAPPPPAPPPASSAGVPVAREAGGAGATPTATAPTAVAGPPVAGPPVARPPVARPPVARPPVAGLPLTELPLTELPLTESPVGGRAADGPAPVGAPADITVPLAAQLPAGPAASSWTRPVATAPLGPERAGAGYLPGGPAPQARRRRRGLRPALVLLAAVVLAAGATAGYLVTRPAPTSAVPALHGDTVAAAGASLERLHLRLAVTGRRYDPSGAAGTVLSQRPEGGRLTQGRAVAVIVSKGPRPVAVPQLAKLTLVQAEAALSRAGLRLGTVNKTPSLTVAGGSVISAAPSSGTLLPGQSVSLVVSTGKPTVVVPTLTGVAAESYAGAAAALDAVGLKTTEQEEYSNTVKAGLVIVTNPAPGIPVTVGTTVVVEVSKGPEMVAVPDLTGDSVTGATQELQDDGLVASGVSGNPIGTVESTTPVGGTLVVIGTSVELNTD